MVSVCKWIGVFMMINGLGWILKLLRCFGCLWVFKEVWVAREKLDWRIWRQPQCKFLNRGLKRTFLFQYLMLKMFVSVLHEWQIILLLKVEVACQMLYVLSFSNNEYAMTKNECMQYGMQIPDWLWVNHVE